MASLHQDKQDIKIHERALKGRAMRLAGLTQQQIGNKLNISIDTVRRDLERIKVDFPEQNVRELVADQNAKISVMLTPQILKAAAGSEKAALAAVKLLEHQAKLFNLFDAKPDDGQAGAMKVLGDFMTSTIEAVQRAQDTRE